MSKTLSDHSYDWLAKVLIIGDSAVGKTNIMLRICDEKFIPSHVTTIGVDFKLKTIEVKGKKIKMQIWDTAGQERFKTITQQYYKGSHGIIMTYAVNDRNSFKSITNWLNQVKEKISNKEVPIVLLANKCDLPDREIEMSEGQHLADSLGIPFYETSAKENIGIKEAFENVATLMLQNFEAEELKDTNGGGLKISDSKKVDKKTKCCN